MQYCTALTLLMTGSMMAGMSSRIDALLTTSTTK